MIAREPRGPGDAAAPAPGGRLWYGLLAAPAAWTLHEVGGYAVMGAACRGGGAGLPTWAWATFVALSVVSVGVAASGALVARGVFRRSTGPVSVWRAEGGGRVELMAVLGTLVSTLLLMNIVLFSVMPLFLRPCVVTT